MPEDPILGEFESLIKRNMLKWHCGHEIFCKSCSAVLDCKRAVEVDVLRGDELLKSLVVCALCYDDARERMEVALAKLNLRDDLRLEVNDGRQLFKRTARCREGGRI